ncbi:hypothetical protein FHN55_17190 [Streptomyces sp. NP160]|uniref:hypothetical protein n=1 Tax=Streptomyces sp. NP160 TaxID=2586637 RepID=UPI00111A62CD|nr:hypothetical protein [Streptomyces sp. NP160]TNM61097.1 hypothetical protein FHN55_17190 [Streptomyces sp. NP160]
MKASTWVPVVSFLVSLGAFVLTRMLTRGLPWWLSVGLAVVAMLLAGRLAAVAAADVLLRVRRRAQARGAVNRS